MKTGTKIVAGVAATLAIVVLVQNAAVTEFQFLFWSISMSRALLFMLFVAIGVVLGWILHALRSRRRIEP